ncbi:MAG: hypothetical protein HYY40_00790 [Bacteroidetes bacterium]|nr:hypothetical protein [Bacteroidota bacterium]
MNHKFTFLFLIFIPALHVVQVNDSIAQQSPPSQEFKPSGKVWGYTFGDFYYKTGGSQTTSWGKGEYSKKGVDEYAFSFRRIYLGYDYNISPDFASSFLLEGSDLSTDPSNRRSIFIKSCYLKWRNLIPRGELRLGLVPAPAWSAFTESLWGYRSLEKTITDFRGMSRAVDAGICLSGIIDSSGNYGYNFLYGNGSGVSPENLQLKVYYGEVYAYFLNKKIVVDGFAEYEPAKEGKDKIILKGLLCFKNDKISAGIEYVRQIWNEGAMWIRISQPAGNYSDTSLSDIISSGISFYLTGNIIKDKLKVVTRFDLFDNDGNSKDTLYAAKSWDATLSTYSSSYASDNTYGEKFAMVALDYTPHKNIHIMPNIWINGYDHKPESVSLPRKTDVAPRLTFHYIFK